MSRAPAYNTRHGYRLDRSHLDRLMQEHGYECEAA
jgi:hypothetical protein